MSVIEMIREVPKLTHAEQSLLLLELQKYLQPPADLSQIPTNGVAELFPFYEAENANHDLSRIVK